MKSWHIKCLNQMCHRPSRQTVKNENSFVRRFGKSKKNRGRTWVVGLEPTILSTGGICLDHYTMVAPIVPDSAQVTGFRVYMHNAEVSCRYYYIEFFIENKIPCSYVAGNQQGFLRFRKRRIAAACTKNEFLV